MFSDSLLILNHLEIVCNYSLTSLTITLEFLWEKKSVVSSANKILDSLLGTWDKSLI